jgi:hypothetical protein
MYSAAPFPVSNCRPGLCDVGVKPEQLDRITESSMDDRWMHANPRKIDGRSVVRELLDVRLVRKEATRRFPPTFLSLDLRQGARVPDVQYRPQHRAD